MSDNLIVVKTFWKEQEAYSAQRLLEAAGIPAYLADATSPAQSDDPAAQDGGVNLQVAEENAEKAAELLTTRPEGVQESYVAAETDVSVEESLARLKEKVDRLEQNARRREKLIVLATFWSVEEAHIARNRLEAEGISAFLADETTAQTLWGLGPIGGVKLHVAERDVERAAALLDTTEDVPPDVDPTLFPDDEEEEEDDEESLERREEGRADTPTPLDNFRDFARVFLSGWLVMIFLLLVLPILAAFLLYLISLLF